MSTQYGGRDVDAKASGATIVVQTTGGQVCLGA